MIFSLFATLIWLISFQGWGFLFIRIWNLPVDEYLPRLQTRNLLLGVLGILFASTVCILINFFIPITSVISLLLCLVGFLVFSVHFKPIIRGLRFENGLSLLIFTSVVSLLASSNHIYLMDTGIYHLQAVKWIKESPLPLGLANLEGKFGFNTIWFVTAALLETPFLSGKSIFILSPLLITLFWIPIQLTRPTPDTELSSLFIKLSILPILSEGLFSNKLVSHSADLATMILTLSTLYLMLLSREQKEIQAPSLFWALILAWICLFIKLSTLPLTAIISWIYFRDKNIPRTHKKRSLLLILIIVIPWMLRGLFLSGCPLYPSSFGCLTQLTWCVPQTTLLGETLVIKNWARGLHTQASLELLNFSWFAPWLKIILNFFSIKLCLGLFGIGMTALYLNYKKKDVLQTEFKSVIKTPLFICLAGILFWFLMAPDPRFAYGFLFGLGLLIFVWGWAECQFHFLAAKLTGFIFILILAILFSPLVYKTLQRSIQWSEWPTLPTRVLVQKKTQEGKEIYTPQKGAIHVGESCWNGPLPCAPFVRPELKIKSKQSQPWHMFYYEKDSPTTS